MDEFGVAIVTDVLSAEDIKQLEGKLNEDLAELVDDEVRCKKRGREEEIREREKRGENEDEKRKK